MAIAGAASLFKLNMQEVVKMLEGQYMPLLVTTLASNYWNMTWRELIKSMYARHQHAYAKIDKEN